MMFVSGDQHDHHLRLFLGTCNMMFVSGDHVVLLYHVLKFTCNVVFTCHYLYLLQII